MVCMKTIVLDYWKGKHELSTMDDQLPVVIYIVSQVHSEHFASEVSMLLDYAAELDNEQRTLINIDSAITYLITDFTRLIPVS